MLRLYDALDVSEAVVFKRPRDHGDTDTSSGVVASLGAEGVVTTSISGVGDLPVTTISTSRGDALDGDKLVISSGAVHDNIIYPPLLYSLARGYESDIRDLFSAHTMCESPTCSLGRETMEMCGVELSCLNFARFYDNDNSFTISRMFRTKAGLTNVDPSLATLERDVLLSRLGHSSIFGFLIFSTSLVIMFVGSVCVSSY